MKAAVAAFSWLNFLRYRRLQYGSHLHGAGKAIMMTLSVTRRAQT